MSKFQGMVLIRSVEVLTFVVTEPANACYNRGGIYTTLTVSD